MQTEQDLEQLVRAYPPALLRYCTGILGNEHDAQDAVQKTFIKAWQRRYTLPDGGNNTRAWLYRIAYRTPLHMLRAATRAAGAGPRHQRRTARRTQYAVSFGPRAGAGARAGQHGLCRAGTHPRGPGAVLTHPLQPGQGQTGRHFTGG